MRVPTGRHRGMQVSYQVFPEERLVQVMEDTGGKAETVLDKVPWGSSALVKEVYVPAVQGKEKKEGPSLLREEDRTSKRIQGDKKP